MSKQKRGFEDSKRRAPDWLRQENRRRIWGEDAAFAPAPPRPGRRRPPGIPSAGARPLARGLVIGVPLVLAVLLVAGVIFREQLGLVPPPPAPESLPLPPDPLAGFDPGIRQALTEPEVLVPATLKLGFRGDPQSLCDEMSAMGLENSGWNRAPFISGAWQCASNLVPLTTPSVDYGPATLFFLLRGPAADKVDYLRLKLNVEDPKQKEIGEKAARMVIAALSDRYGWAVPDAFLQAVRDYKPLETTDRGVRLSVAPEDPNLTGDPAAARRLNIIIDFGDPELIRPADGFERQQ